MRSLGGVCRSGADAADEGNVTLSPNLTQDGIIYSHFLNRKPSTTKANLPYLRPATPEYHLVTH
jgi:hypothetical protein